MPQFLGIKRKQDDTIEQSFKGNHEGGGQRRYFKSLFFSLPILLHLSSSLWLDGGDLSTLNNGF